ncbi:hypothetical protein MY10362_009059, partial [Beauveria mimosiformis]
MGSLRADGWPIAMPAMIVLTSMVYTRIMEASFIYTAAVTRRKLHVPHTRRTESFYGDGSGGWQ